MRDKRQRDDHHCLIFKDGKAALEWCKKSLESIVLEGLKLSLLDMLYSMRSGLNLNEMPLRDLLGSISNFSIQQSMPSLEETFGDFKLRGDCQTLFQKNDFAVYSVDAFFASYQNQLKIKRGEIETQFVDLWEVNHNALQQHGGNELEAQRIQLENFQKSFEENSLLRTCPDLRDQFLVSLYNELRALFEKFQEQLNGRDGILDLFTQALASDSLEDEVSLLALQLLSKMSFLSHFTCQIRNYLKAEDFQAEFIALFVQIDFNSIFYEAKYILKVCDAGGLKKYARSLEHQFKTALEEYQEITWNDFRVLDLAQASATLDDNIRQLKFLKRFNGGVAEALLDQFEIIRGLLALRSHIETEPRNFLEDFLRVDELEEEIGDLFSEEAKLKSLHARSKAFNNTKPFCQEIFNEFFSLQDKLKSDLAIAREKTFENEITLFYQRLSEFRKPESLDEGSDLKVRMYWFCRSTTLLEWIDQAKRVYALGDYFPIKPQINNLLNEAFLLLQKWSEDFKGGIKKAVLSNKNMDELMDVLPSFKVSYPGWRELFLEALEGLQKELNAKIIREIKTLDSVHCLLGVFFRAKIRATGQLFTDPDQVTVKCFDVVRRLEQKIEAINKLKVFSLKLANSTELRGFLKYWEDFRKDLEKMKTPYVLLKKLPKITKKQLTEQEILIIQKNGDYLIFAKNSLSFVRPILFNKLLKDKTRYYIDEAKHLLSKIREAHLFLEQNFSPIEKIVGEIEEMSALEEEHKSFFKEFYFPRQQKKYERICEMLDSCEEDLVAYLEKGGQSENLPEIPNKRQKSDTVEASPQLGF